MVRMILQREKRDRSKYFTTGMDVKATKDRKEEAQWTLMERIRDEGVQLKLFSPRILSQRLFKPVESVDGPGISLWIS